MTRLSSRSFLRQLDLGTLDLFLLILDSGSIARAAEHGRLAASAVSKRIAELEVLVGSPLFERHARGVHPTRAGERLARHARTLVNDVEHLRQDINRFTEGVQGTVRVCASASALEQFLPADLASFAESNPDIRIDLRQGSSRVVAHAVQGRKAELGICGDCEEVAPLQSRAYRMERLVLVTPPGHPLARWDTLEFAEALDFEQVGLRGSSTVQATLNQVARSAGRELRQRLEVDSLSALCRMVECGIGIGVMPLGALQAMGEQRLHAATLADAWAVRPLRLYAIDFGNLSPAAGCFVERLTADVDA
jgi:DNA-binding transcriptional LysR family regulator